MIGYAVRRLVLTIPVLIGAAIAVFFMLHLVPGDPVTALMGSVQLPAEQQAAMRASLGLDQPLLVQLGEYLIGLLQGDLGTSVRSGRPVSSLIFSQLPATLELTASALGIAIAIGVPLGVLAAHRPNSLTDLFSMSAAIVGVSIPHFWLALMLMLVFAVTLGWVPAISTPGSLRSLILPAISLGVAEAAIIARLVRASMVEVLGLDYIRTAHAKGLGSKLVTRRHALRNALVPVLTMIGLQAGNLLGGAVVIELVFARPGLGQLVINGIIRRDLPVVQGAILLIAVLFVFFNLLVDLLYPLVDPRIKLR